MRKILTVGLGLGLVLFTHSAFAACATQSITVKDAAGSTQTFCLGGGASTLLNQSQIVDPTGANILAINASGQITLSNTAFQANAGTNLNTSALALETGGNLATVAGAISGGVFQGNTKQVNGVTTSTGAGAVGTGSQRVAIGTDTSTIAGSAPGTAGTPSANVVTVQGPTSSGIPVPANTAQINGVTPLMGNGTTGTGSQRVTVASDNTAFSVNSNTASVNGVTTLTGAGATGTGSQRVTVAQDSNTVAGSASVPAGENHIGEVGGNAIVVTNAMTTSNNTVTTGKAIGGLQTLANMVRVSGTLGNSGTTGLIQNVVVTFKDAVGQGALDVYFFNANPSGSTCTDNTTFALVAADFAKVIGIAHVSDFTAGNPVAVGQAQQLALAYGLSSATSAFACVVARASFAITGTTNADLIVGALRN